MGAFVAYGICIGAAIVSFIVWGTNAWKFWIAFAVFLFVLWGIIIVVQG